MIGTPFNGLRIKRGHGVNGQGSDIKLLLEIEGRKIDLNIFVHIDEQFVENRRIIVSLILGPRIRRLNVDPESVRPGPGFIGWARTSRMGLILRLLVVGQRPLVLCAQLDRLRVDHLDHVVVLIDEVSRRLHLIGFDLEELIVAASGMILDDDVLLLFGDGLLVVGVDADGVPFERVSSVQIIRSRIREIVDPLGSPRVIRTPVQNVLEGTERVNLY